MTSAASSHRSRPEPEDRPPLRVTHLAKWAPPARGGIETVVGELTAALAGRTDVDADVCCFALRSGVAAVAPNVTLRRFRTRTVIASAPISFRLLLHWLRIRRRGTDVVHVHIPNPWAALLVVLLPTRASVVVSVHGVSTRHRLLARAHDALVDRMLRRADAVFASARSNVTLFGLDRYGDKVRIVPYGVDPARLAGAPDDGDGSEPAGGVLFCGRLVYYKGLDTLAR